MCIAWYFGRASSARVFREWFDLWTMIQQAEDSGRRGLMNTLQILRNWCCGRHKKEKQK